MLLHVISKRSTSVAQSREPSQRETRNQNIVMADSDHFANRLIGLQKTIGNQAVQHLILRSSNIDEDKKRTHIVDRNNQLVNTNPAIGHLLMQITSKPQEKAFNRENVPQLKELTLQNRSTPLPTVKPVKFESGPAKAKAEVHVEEGEKIGKAVEKGREKIVGKKEEEGPTEKQVQEEVEKNEELTEDLKKGKEEGKGEELETLGEGRMKKGVEPSAPGVKTEEGGERAPSSPWEDPAFQAVIKSASVVAEQQGHNNPAMRKVTEAQAAAPGPANEVAGKAAASQVEKMNAQEPAPFDRSKFKAALLKEIESKTPKTLGAMEEFKKSGQTANIKGAVTSQVQEGKETAQGPIKQETEKAPDTSSAQPKSVVPLPPTDAGPAPPGIGAEQATPKPKTQSEISLAEGNQELDKTMTDAGVTEEQLANSNETEFQSALESKKNVQTHSLEAPEAYRKDEATILVQTKTQAVDSTTAQIQQMHTDREQQFSGVVAGQLNTMDVDAVKREEVASHLNSIYEESKAQVIARLEALDNEVNTIFDKGAEQARQTFDDSVDNAVLLFKLKRYGNDPILILADWFNPPHEDLNRIYLQERENYVKYMDAVIDQVAVAVEVGLNEAKGMIAAGLQQVQEHVSSLEPGLQAIAMEEVAKIQKNFDTLRQSVDQKHDQLVTSLAQKYVENLQKVDDRIEEMKRENRGLLDQAADALGGVIKTILELKEMLLGVLARAGDVIEIIIKDPITFVGNLASGVKAGLQNFVSNIGTHLQKGFMGWLFGTLAKAGIQMPESLDLKGILSLVMQVLGLTYANIRARAVGILGEKVVVVLEQAFEIFKILITEGPSGLWRYIKEKAEGLKTMVIEGIKSYLIEKVVVAGITWIVSMLNPASAFVKAAKAIYDIIMFIVNRGSQIMDLVNAVLDSVSAIASGAIGVAASAVENALARAIPVAIGFLASLLGLGDISEKIGGFVKKGQAFVNMGIDFVINKAVQWVKAAGKMLFGIGKKRKEGEAEEEDPEKKKKIEQGLDTIDQEEGRYIQEGKISFKNAERVAKTVKSQHPVFKSITVVDAGDKWNYHYKGSDGTKEGEPKEVIIDAAAIEGIITDAKAVVDAETDLDLEAAFAEYNGPSTTFRRPPLRRAKKTAEYEEAVKEYKRVRKERIQELELEEAEFKEIHHAVELQALNRYPGVFTGTELNSLKNMRGIPSEEIKEIEGEVKQKKQLHDSAIRLHWNRHYRNLDAQLNAKRIKPDTTEYRSHVRSYLESARQEIDHILGQFFSEYRKVIFNNVK